MLLCFVSNQWGRVLVYIISVRALHAKMDMKLRCNITAEGGREGIQLTTPVVFSHINITCRNIFMIVEKPARYKIIHEKLFIEDGGSRIHTKLWFGTYTLSRLANQISTIGIYIYIPETLCNRAQDCKVSPGV